MSFELAMRLCEILLALAFIQSSTEHLTSRVKSERALFCVRLILALGLLSGLQTTLFCISLSLHAFFMLWRFHGPYNGGSDRMGLLILFCITLAHILPEQYWKEVAFGYLALQLTLSYFMAGYVKIINPDWRSGRALQDVFLFSTYPVSEGLRTLAERPRILLAASWCVLIFELIFPLMLLEQNLLIICLSVAVLFHLSNAFLFGLNRFFWIWIAAYPALLWFHSRVIIIFF